MAGIFDGPCDNHYTLTVTMCNRSHQPCIGKIQCDRLLKIAQEMEDDNALTDGIHDALAYYNRSLDKIAKTVAQTGDMSGVMELIDLDERTLASSPSCTSFLIDQYRTFVSVYVNTDTWRHELENLMSALVLMETNMNARGIPVPLPTSALSTW